MSTVPKSSDAESLIVVKDKEGKEGKFCRFCREPILEVEKFCIDCVIYFD